MAAKKTSAASRRRTKTPEPKKVTKKSKATIEDTKAERKEQIEALKGKKAAEAAEKKAAAKKEAKPKSKPVIKDEKMREAMAKFGMSASFVDDEDEGSLVTISFGEYEMSFPDRDQKTAREIMKNVYAALKDRFDIELHKALKESKKTAEK